MQDYPAGDPRPVAAVTAGAQILPGVESVGADQHDPVVRGACRPAHQVQGQRAAGGPGARPAAGHPVRAGLGPGRRPARGRAAHGFPDTAWTWRHLGPHLAGLGWRVVARLRGYAPSGLPRDGSVHVGAVMADAVAIHERLDGDDRAVLVGHDWGAIAVNALNGHEDSPFARAVTVAVPPMQAMAGFDAGLMLRQARNSWYILFNQLRLPRAHL